MAGSDKVMAERVHEMKQPGGAIWVPPCGCQGIEVRDFGGIDGGSGALGTKLVLYEPGC